MTVIDPAKKQHAIRRTAQDVFQFQDTSQLGVYDVRRSDQVIERFAVNLFDRQESDVRVRPSQGDEGTTIQPADIRIGNVDVPPRWDKLPRAPKSGSWSSRVPCSCWYWNGISTTAACTL